MSNKYFDQFKQISYNGYNSRNLLQRAKITDSVAGNPFAFYPYELKPGQRADTIANQYYSDSYLSWLVYFSNKTIDPYYDYHMNEDEFVDYIVMRYGSIVNAMNRIKMYRVNWYDDSTTITVSFYNNNLPSAIKKYWDPVLNEISQPLAYRRKEIDWVVNTNMIMNLPITMLGANTFVGGELVSLYANSTTQTVMATGEIVASNTTSLDIKNISSNGTISTSNRVLGTTSIASANISGSPVVLSQPLPDSEAVYWSPVSFFDYESEINADKVNIKLLDVRLQLQAVEEFKKKMK